VLGIFGYTTEDLYPYSDAICTALQLTNFWQDVSRDLAMGRIYLPEEDMRAFGVAEEDLRNAPASQPFRDLLRFQVERTRALSAEGRPLVRRVEGLFRVDLLMFSRGGEAILDAIERQDFDVIERRPVLGRAQRTRLLMRALGDALTGTEK
jgi:phytoene/squalene synthetase